ncbi:MAG: hypothetical protein AB1428_00255 [Bacteroidota bacterium]
MPKIGHAVRHVAAALAAGCAISALNCFNDPLTPVPPKWDTNLTLPLSNRNITLQEIVEKDSTFLRSGGGNQLVYVSSTTAAPTTVADKVTVNPPAASGSIALGAFEVALASVNVPLQSPDLPSGSTMQVPPMNFGVPDVANAVDIPVDVLCASGRARLTLTNNMDIPVTVMTPIEIRDGAVVHARFVFSGVIPPRGSAWAEDDLTGDRIVAGEDLGGLSFSTTGSGGATVTIPPNILVATLTASGVTATSASVPSLPAQRLKDNSTAGLALRDSTKIRSITVRSGRLDLTFTSRLPIAVRLRFRFPEVTRQPGGGAPYEDSVAIAAGGAQTFQVNLAGYTITSPSPNALLDSIHLVSTVVIPSPVNTSVTMHDTDKVLVDMRGGTPVVADTAAVVLKPTWVDINTVVPFDFGKLPSKFTGTLNLPAASLGLNLTSSVGFPADLSLRIAARKATGDSAVLVLPGGQQRILPGTSLIAFNDPDVGQFLSQLSPRLPDSARITGRVLINPPDVYTPTPAGVGSIGWNSAVGGVINLNVPMRLGLTDGMYQDTVVWGDTNADGTVDNSSNREDLDNVNSGTVYAEIRNGLPVQLGLAIQCLDATRRGLITIPQAGGTIGVAAGSVDGTGVVTVPANGSAVIPLSHADVQLIRQADFVRYALNVVTAGNGGIVTMRSTDALQIRMWMQFSFKVNP